MVIGGRNPGEQEDIELSEMFPEHGGDEDSDPIDDFTSEDDGRPNKSIKIGRNGKPITRRKKVKRDLLKLEAARHTPRVVLPPAKETEGDSAKPAQEEERGAASATVPGQHPAGGKRTPVESIDQREQTGPQPPSRG